MSLCPSSNQTKTAPPYTDRQNNSKAFSCRHLFSLEKPLLKIDKQIVKNTNELSTAFTHF